MKKLMIVGMMIATMAVTFTGCGGHDKIYTSNTRYTSSPIPDRVINEFYQLYPSAVDADWKMNDGLYKVDFKVGGDDMKATFTPNGDLVKING